MLMFLFHSSASRDMNHFVIFLFRIFSCYNMCWNAFLCVAPHRPIKHPLIPHRHYRHHLQPGDQTLPDRGMASRQPSIRLPTRLQHRAERGRLLQSVDQDRGRLQPSQLRVRVQPVGRLPGRTRNRRQIQRPQGLAPHHQRWVIE